MGLVSWTLLTAWEVSRPMLRLFRSGYDISVSLLFMMFMSWRRRTSLPPVFNPILLQSATELARNIRDRKVTSVEVVRAYITRLSEVNPLLNGLAQENFQAALMQARKVDETLEKGYRDGTLLKEDVEKNQPFLGVPFTVKEFIALKGHPHSAGLVARSGVVARSDAEVVTRVKKAGSIPLGNTNVSELGMWWESNNYVYGRTNNPYDPRRTPGGSSGGEAALMSACGSPISICTDTGGSIRIPAFFSGLFGHKPTNGVVPLTGCNIHRDVDYDDIQVAGPLTRHACDLAPLLNILAGDNVSKLSLEKKVNLGRLNVYTMESDGDEILTTAICPELLQAQRSVVQHFCKTHDTDVKKINIPGMRWSFQVTQNKMEEEYNGDPSLTQQLADNKGEIDFYKEMRKSLTGRARHTVPLLAQVAFEKVIGKLNFLREQKNALRGRKQLKRSKSVEEDTQWKTMRLQIQRVLGDDGILVYPSHPTLAPYHREPVFRPLNYTYTAIFNALGFPVTQVPLGLSENGLPLGVQVVAGMHQDHISIAVAADLEKAFGGWVCPAKVM
ncbi:unnamed protein product [Meganyctiphanes norvegica]|uniref:Amidase domain-containing protein n=1 Tax=Meganyctiphanes norvegica TaxID=48144 RepID=A0AAV2QHW8_MEGNR